jgi:hypothetical protein
VVVVSSKLVRGRQDVSAAHRGGCGWRNGQWHILMVVVTIRNHRMERLSTGDYDINGFKRGTIIQTSSCGISKGAFVDSDSAYLPHLTDTFGATGAAQLNCIVSRWLVTVTVHNLEHILGSAPEVWRYFKPT